MAVNNKRQQRAQARNRHYLQLSTENRDLKRQVARLDKGLMMMREREAKLDKIAELARGEVEEMRYIMKRIGKLASAMGVE